MAIKKLVDIMLEELEELNKNCWNLGHLDKSKVSEFKDAIVKYHHAGLKVPFLYEKLVASYYSILRIENATRR